MSRWIGIDYGRKRIGVALADPGATIATPAATLAASGNASDDAKRILQWAAENEATGIVVGLPLNMDGSVGSQAIVSQELARQLERNGRFVIRVWDERLTTFQADQVLEQARVRPARRKRLRDALAAQAILQSFLDAQRPPGAAPHASPSPGADELNPGLL